MSNRDEDQLLTDGGRSDGGIDRRHFYLIVDSPNEDHIGNAEARESPYQAAEKNERRTVEMRNHEKNKTWTEEIVGLGYHDFEDKEDYQESWVDVLESKLEGIDPEYLEAAGIEPEGVVG